MTQRANHALILQAAHHYDPERLQRAVCQMAEGRLSVTPIHSTATELRACVSNSDGIEYNVSLMEAAARCSCRDALFRHATCKHAMATALCGLQLPDLKDACIHLMWADSSKILCGAALTPTTRFWQRWTENALNWADLVCQPCVYAWTHPQSIQEAA